MHTRNLQTGQEITYLACVKHSFTDHSIHSDLVDREYISTLGFQDPSSDKFENHGWGGFQLVCRFVGKPERSVDTLSAGMAKAVEIWIHLGMLLFLEGPTHASGGSHPIFHYKRSDHVEMVEITLPARRWEKTTFY